MTHVPVTKLTSRWPTVIGTGSLLLGLQVGAPIFIFLTMSSSTVREGSTTAQVSNFTNVFISAKIPLMVAFSCSIAAFGVFARKHWAVFWLQFGSVIAVFDYATNFGFGLLLDLWRWPSVLIFGVQTFVYWGLGLISDFFWPVFILLWLQRPSIKQQILERWIPENVGTRTDKTRGWKSCISTTGAVVGGIVGGVSHTTSIQLLGTPVLFGAMPAFSGAMLGILAGVAGGVLGKRVRSMLVSGVLSSWPLLPLAYSRIPITLSPEILLRSVVPFIVFGLIAGATGGAAAEGSNR